MSEGKKINYPKSVGFVKKSSVGNHITEFIYWLIPIICFSASTLSGV